MNVTELKKDKLEFHAKVVIPKAKIASAISKELESLSKKVKLPGFRSGKVPISIVSKKYGASVRNDVVGQEVSHTIDHVIKDHKLNVLGEPKIEEFKGEEGKDVEFVLKVDLMPEIKLPDFKKISIEKPILKVGEKDIDEKLEKLAEISKDFSKEVKGKAAIGDQVTLDAIGYIDEEAFDGGKLENHKLILGSKSFIDTFEDQLVGHKAGDEVVVKVNFPENYHSKNLAGKPAEFKVKIRAVHKAEASEVNDEFAKKFKFDNVEKLREQISKNIASSYDDAINTMMKMRLFDQLEEDLKFEVPVSLLERENQILQKQAEQSEEIDPSLKDMPEKKREQYYKKIALRRVKIGLMLAEYVKIKGLRIEQEDIRAAVLAQAQNFPGQEHQVIDFYSKNPKAIEGLQGPILEEKAVQHIFSNEITLSEKKYSQKDLEKLLEKENSRDLA